MGWKHRVNMGFTSGQKVGLCGPKCKTLFIFFKILNVVVCSMHETQVKAVPHNRVTVSQQRATFCWRHYQCLQCYSIALSWILSWFRTSHLSAFIDWATKHLGKVEDCQLVVPRPSVWQQGSSSSSWAFVNGTSSVFRAGHLLTFKIKKKKIQAK